MKKLLPFYVGCQNDGIYIISGKPPSANNDYPIHDADRTVIARIYPQDDTARQIAAACNFHEAQSLMLRKLGYMVCEVIEQAMKNDWKDKYGKKCIASSSMNDLVKALEEAMKLCMAIDAANTK